MGLRTRLYRVHSAPRPIQKAEVRSDTLISLTWYVILIFFTGSLSTMDLESDVKMTCKKVAKALGFHSLPKSE